MTSAREQHARRLTASLERNARDLLRYLERRVGTNDAADALSETMIAAWRHSTRLPDDDAEARMWLFGIARNTILNVTRGERRRTRLAQRLQQSAGDLEAPDATEGTEIRDAIERLSPDLAEIIRAVHWDGFTLTEVSQYLGLPASTIRSRYARAKQVLAATLELGSTTNAPASDALPTPTSAITRPPASAGRNPQGGLMRASIGTTIVSARQALANDSRADDPN